MKIKNFLLVLILILGFIFLIFNFYFESFVFLVSFLFGVLIFKIIDRLKLKNYNYYIIYLSLWLSIIGEMGLYARVEIYDKLLHLLIPFLICFTIYDFIKDSNVKYKFFLIFFIVLGFGGLFEAFEFLSDYSLGLDMGGVTNVSGELLMNEWHDTIWDLIFTMIGSFIFIIIKNGRTILHYNHKK